MADASGDPMAIFHELKLVLLIIIPLGVLFALIYHFKTKAQSEIKEGIVDSDLMKEQMEKAAQEKLSQREKKVDLSGKPRLTPDEIRKKIESEREEYPEFNPIIPLQDLEDDEQESEEKPDDGS